MKRLIESVVESVLEKGLKKPVRQLCYGELLTGASLVLCLCVCGLFWNRFGLSSTLQTLLILSISIIGENFVAGRGYYRDGDIGLRRGGAQKFPKVEFTHLSEKWVSRSPSVGNYQLSCQNHYIRIDSHSALTRRLPSQVKGAGFRSQAPARFVSAGKSRRSSRVQISPSAPFSFCSNAHYHLCSPFFCES